MRYVPKPEEEGVNYGFENQIKSFFILSFGLASLVAGCTLVLALLMEPILLRISPSWEHSLFSSIRLGKQFSEGQELLQELIGNDAEHYSVRVLCEEEINAFAYPGNAIIITSGLLEKIESKNSLAFVLGHEFGHFQNRDHVRGLSWGFSVFLVRSMIGVGSAGESSIIQDFLVSSHSRSQEEKADLVAGSLVEKRFNGLDGAAQFFKAMSEESLFEDRFFSSHPLTQNRIADIEARARGKAKIIPQNYAEIVKGYCN